VHRAMWAPLLAAVPAVDSVTSATPLLPTNAPLFHRVLFLSLEGATERHEHMRRTLREAHLSAQWWNASVVQDGRAAVEQNAELAFMSHLAQMPVDSRDFRNTLGCRLSHQAIMSHLIRTGGPGERYLVLEDDVDLPSGFGEHAAHAVLAAAPPGWDVLRLGCRLTPSDTTRPLSELLDDVAAGGFCPACITNVTSSLSTANFDVLRLQDHPHSKSCDPSASPHCSYVPGGTHAIVYNWESLPRVLAGLGHRLNIDVAMSMPADASLASYCLQVPGVGVATLASTRLESPPGRADP